MKMQLRRIGALSAARVTGVLYFLLGAIAALFLLLASGLGGFAGAGANRGNFNPPDTAIIILIPVFYGVGGFIGGLIMAALYNVVAGLTGGLEFDLEMMDATRASNAYQTPDT